MTSDKPESPSAWIIGYGNPHRRDDGIGPYVIQQLSRRLEKEEKITLGSFHQLEPVLLDELREAEVVILVDATVENLEQGLRWTKVQPERDFSLRGTHHLKPATFMGLMEALYRRCPSTWLVSVQGVDFGFGEGLSLEAQEKAERASSEILDFCLREIVDKGH